MLPVTIKSLLIVLGETVWKKHLKGNYQPDMRYLCCNMKPRNVTLNLFYGFTGKYVYYSWDKSNCIIVVAFQTGYNSPANINLFIT